MNASPVCYLLGSDCAEPGNELETERRSEERGAREPNERRNETKFGDYLFNCARRAFLRAAHAAEPSRAARARGNDVRNECPGVAHKTQFNTNFVFRESQRDK